MIKAHRSRANPFDGVTEDIDGEINTLLQLERDLAGENTMQGKAGGGRLKAGDLKPETQLDSRTEPGTRPRPKAPFIELIPWSNGRNHERKHVRCMQVVCSSFT